MHGVQGTFDELGTPLSAVTFVVVDLETTGGSPGRRARITEIGAVKVRGGEVLGEFQTLVNPGDADPAVHLGAHRHHRRDGRRRPAHRAASCRRSSSSPAAPCSSPTTRRSTSASSRRPAAAHRPRLARVRRCSTPPTWPASWCTRDEAPNCKLSTLAALFRRHHDARPPGAARRAGHRRRAARPASSGSATLGVALPRGAARPSPPGSRRAQRRKRHLAEALPDRARRLPVRGRARAGCSTSARPRDLRTRVRTYFTATETRTRMAEMVRPRRVASRPIVCATTARGRGPRAAADRRAQAALQPPLALPRARAVGQAHRRAVPAAVHRARGRATTARRYLGPFGSRLGGRGGGRGAARGASRCASAPRGCPARGRRSRLRAGRDGPLRRAVHRAASRSTTTPCVVDRAVRPCSSATPATGRRRPCARGSARLADRRAVRGRRGRPRPAGRPGPRRPRARSGSTPLAASPELVAARRCADGGWEVVCVRHGRLAGTDGRPRGADPLPYVDALRATAEVVAPPAPARARPRTAEETERVLRWLERAGRAPRRRVDGAWACPVHGAGARAGQARAAGRRAARRRRLRRPRSGDRLAGLTGRSRSARPRRPLPRRAAG